MTDRSGQYFQHLLRLADERHIWQPFDTYDSYFWHGQYDYIPTEEDDEQIFDLIAEWATPEIRAQWARNHPGDNVRRLDAFMAGMLRGRPRGRFQGFRRRS